MVTFKRTSLRNGNEARAQRADKEASDMMPLIKEIQASGKSSLRSIAEELNQRGITTSSGSIWYSNSVKRILDRVQDSDRPTRKNGRMLKEDPTMVCKWREDNQATIAETARHFGIGTATVKRYLQMRKV